MMRTLARKPHTAPSLSATLTFAFLTFGVLILSISTVLQLVSGIHAQQRAIAGDQQLIAQDAATKVSSFVQDEFNVLETAIWLTNPHAESPEQRKLMLDSLLGLQPAFRELDMLNADGQALARASRLPRKAPWSIPEQFEREGLLQSRQRARYISPVYIDPVTSEPLMVMAVAVTDTLRDFKGSLAIELNLKFMWDLVSHLKVRETGHAYVVDRNGTLIAFRDTARVLKGENVGNLRPISEFIRSPATARAGEVATYPGITGEIVVGTYVPLGTPDWAVVTELPWDEAYREVIGQAEASFGILLIMAVVASLLGMYLARRLAVPLVNLTDTATHIAEGKRELQANVGGPREVASLATAFNSMTAQLRQSLEELEHQVEEVRQAERSLRQANGALQESEEKLRQIASSLREVIWLRDVQTRQVLYVNPAFEELTGWTCQSFYENPDVVINAVHPEDRELVIKALHQRFEDVPFDVEHRIVHRNGSVRWVSGRSFPVRNEAGQVYRWASIMEDITERKKAEEALRESKDRFRLLVETTSDWVWEVDARGFYTYASPRVTDVLGYRPEEILGKTPFDLMPAEEAEALRAEFQRIVESHRPFEGMENKNRHKDGRIVILETNGVPVFDEKGNLLSYRGIDRDITEYKKSQEEQRRLQEQLQQATKMEAVGQLAGGIAHDFNNLLTAILGNIDLARLDLDPADPAMKFFDEIGSAARSAASLTRQLLAFARRQIIQPKVFNLNDLVSSFQKVLTRLLGEDIKLEIYLHRELGSVRVDPGQIEQVLVNLATNARAAMPTGGTLVIETSNLETDREYNVRHTEVLPGRYVLLSVSDTGHGMSPEVKAHLFEPFFTTKPVGHGTGLGLATVFGIVKQARGVIEASSEEGRGTRFDIYLPRIDERSQQIVEERAAGELPTGSQTILVIEDNDSVRMSAVKALEHLGYKVLSPSTAAEVVDFVASYQDRIDLLMTDVVMPGVTGPELADRLLVMRPEMKVLFTSGYTQNVIAHHGVIEGDLNFIAKPYTIQELAAKIREVLTSG